MHPVLFTVFGYPVSAYGSALLLAFTVGIWVAKRRTEARGLDGEAVVDVAMVILFSSILGARLLFVVTHLDEFRPPRGLWLDAFNPLQSSGQLGIVGLSMLGGVILALAAALVFLRWKRLPVLAFSDLLAPSVALGEGITRIGCFLNGCCFGKVCALPWAVLFPLDSGPSRVLGHIPLHPTQLYASVCGFALFGLLVWLARKPHPDGWIACWYFVIAGSARIYFDFLRYYEPEVIFFRLAGVGITVNQLLSAGLVLLAVGGLLALRGKSAARGAG